MENNHEIIDEPFIKDPKNSTQIHGILQLSIGTIALFFIFEKIRNYVPENLIEWNGVKIRSIGLLIIGIVILNSILIPKYLSKLNPKLSIIKIVGYTGLIILGIEVLFKIVQNVAVLQNGLYLDYFDILKNAGILSLLSMLIANIATHKIRNKKVLSPILILVLLWISIGLLIR